MLPAPLLAATWLWSGWAANDGCRASTGRGGRGARAHTHTQDLEAWLRALDGVITHIRQILLLLSKTTNSSRENLMWL